MIGLAAASFDLGKIGGTRTASIDLSFFNINSLCQAYDWNTGAIFRLRELDEELHGNTNNKEVKELETPLGDFQF